MSQSTLPRNAAPGFPRGALLGAAALISFSILAALYGRMTGSGVNLPPTQAIAERSLWFQDRADGRVIVLDASNDRRVTVIEPGTNGFLRATVRGLAQQRMREDLGKAVPFHLVAWADGRLTLTDPTTGRHIDLEAFGSTNEGVFAGLLRDKETAR